MRLVPSDPDIQTILARIDGGDLDLQPDFQRGEVWSDSKKRKLIDSVLRDWHVPPIHVVEIAPSGVHEVLDGQQRLVAIRDFAAGRIRVDGHTEPADTEIEALHGLSFDQLPPDVKRRFNRFTIRVFQIVDYRPKEPAELFYRLNQPMALTSAEQRNAFFGAARSQVRDLVAQFEKRGLDKDSVGFSNSRMAYDDVVARVCHFSQTKSLAANASAQTLAAAYRREGGFDRDAVDRTRRALELFVGARGKVAGSIHFNKATLFSWLWFSAGLFDAGSSFVDTERLANYLTFFENLKADLKSVPRDGLHIGTATLSGSLVSSLILVYNDRSSARVSDTFSLVSRDVVLWTLFLAFLYRAADSFGEASWEERTLVAALSSTTERDADELLSALIGAGWGDLR